MKNVSKNVSELSGVQLDLAVCMAHGWEYKQEDLTIINGDIITPLSELDFHKNWKLSGDLMEREHIFPIRMSFEDNKKYLAQTNVRTIKKNDLTFVPFGNTAIECVLRCYVGHYLGSKLELPIIT